MMKYLRYASLIMLTIPFSVTANAADTAKPFTAQPRLTAPVNSNVLKNKLQVKTPVKAHILSRKADINARMITVTPKNIELTSPSDSKKVQTSCHFENIGMEDSGPVVLKVRLEYGPNVPFRYKREMAKTVNNIPSNSSGKPMGTGVNAPHLGKYYEFNAESHIAGTNVNSPYTVTCSATPLAHETGKFAANNSKTDTVTVKRTY